MSKKKFLSSFLTVIFFATIIVVAVFWNNSYDIKVSAQESNNKMPVKGYAWSDNIGWIKFNPRYGGVFYDKTSKKLSGYAWSDNIGWIYFGPESANDRPADNVPEDPKKWAEIDDSNDSWKVSGWARAYRAIETEDQTLGGWDGWIKFNTGKENSVTVQINETNPNIRDFHGYAWGSDVIGWISFNCKEGGPGGSDVCDKSDYKVWIDVNPDVCGSDCNPKPGKLEVSCSANPAVPKAGDEITFTATVKNGTPDYTYIWKIDKKTTKVTTGERINSIKKIYSKVGSKVVFISVVDSSKPKQNQDNQCSLDIADKTPKPNIKIIEI